MSLTDIAVTRGRGGVGPHKETQSTLIGRYMWVVTSYKGVMGSDDILSGPVVFYWRKNTKKRGCYLI